MADNVTLSAMAGGSVIAADDVSSVFYQRVKLDGGGDGAAAPILGDSTNGLDVDVTRLPALVAGEAIIGVTGGIVKSVLATYTRPANTTAYASGDVVNNSTSAPTILTFDAVARANGGTGRVVGANLIDGSNQATKGIFELWLFDTTITMDNDNAVFTPTDAELQTLIGVIPFTIPYVGDATSGAGGNAVYVANGFSLPFKCGGGVDDIFGVLVVRNAYTPTSAGTFAVRLLIEQN